MAQEGQTLTATSGSWSGTTPIAYGYQWQTCAPTGTDCGPIAGATVSTYAVTTGDVGTTIRVLVTATNAAGSVSDFSAATAVVQSAGAPPANTSPPTISGTAQAGQPLTASPGTWTGTQPISYAYQWQRCDSSGANCNPITGASSAGYTATTADVGRTAFLHDRAALENHQPVGEGHGVDRVVGHEQLRTREIGELATDLPPQRSPGPGVDRGQRFVEKQKSRRWSQGAGERHALGLSARELVGSAAGHIADAGPLEPVPCSGEGIGPARPTGTEPEGHVLHRREVGEEAAVLEDDANGTGGCGHAHAADRVLEHVVIEHDQALIDWK